ncbi:MAG: protein kinase [Ignavibacteriales bacterium]|nr:MAG: protein kinase [Ignavibacteriales bacterium]
MINNRYEIISKLGRGRSTVYLCSDVENENRNVAVKILSGQDNDSKEVFGFREEFFTLQRLNHPNIVKVFDLGNVITSDDEDIPFGSYFFTLEVFEATSLDKFDLHPDDVNEIIKQICSVLHYLHQSNFIYYDLKPENILVRQTGDKPEIRFIDFGLAEHLPDTRNYQPKGTAQYIAPEILKKQDHDYRVDIYSLGILLYQLAYKKFPFDVIDELQIYKAHLESEFDFPDYAPDNKLPGVIQKSLAKDPAERYDSVLNILIDLDIPIDKSLTKDFLKAKVFTNRRDVLAILRKYIHDATSYEVFTIRGYESMGKTFLAEEAARIYENVILINELYNNTGIEFIRFVIRKIYYQLSSFKKLSESTKSQLGNWLSPGLNFNTYEVKKIFSLIAAETDFILVFDGFNKYDTASQELLLEIIPILQVNKRKVILTEESDYTYTSEQLNNLQEINISPFTDANLSEYLAKSFYKIFPTDEVRQLILLYADLLPGSIETFLKDILLFGVVDYQSGLPQLLKTEEIIRLLKSSHDEIYKARLSILSNDEIEFVRLLSLFETSVNSEALRFLIPSDFSDEKILLDELAKKNILQNNQASSEPVFTSSGLKKYIYSTIKNVSELHGNVAFRLRENKAKIGRIELARQFELAGLYDESYSLLMQEVEDAEEHSAHSYQKKLLTHINTFPLSFPKTEKIILALLKVSTKLNDHTGVLKLVEGLDVNTFSLESQDQIELFKAKALVGAGQLAEAHEIMSGMLIDREENPDKIKLMLDLAYVEFDLTNISRAKQNCELVIQSKFADYESLGRANNLLGLIAYSHYDNFETALSYFIKSSEMYEKAGQSLNQLKIEINIGNMFYLRGNTEEGLRYWSKAQKTNEDVGNLEYEALIIMNLGAYNFGIGKYEEAEENYNRASGVFISIGNKMNYCNVLNNLSEIYIETCRYDEAYNSLQDAKRSLFLMENYELEADVLFTLGKFYFYSDSEESLKKTISDYEKVLNKVVLSDRYYNNFNLLKLLTRINNKDEDIKDELKKLINNFFEFDDKYNFVKFTFILVNYLLERKMYAHASEELNNKTIINLCLAHNIHEVERLYLLAELALSGFEDLPQPAFSYLNQAYEKLESVSITDITWKVLYALAEFYYVRGNKTKFNELFGYSKSVMNYMIQQIKDANLRSKFLNKADRKKTLLKFDSWEINING